jgi:hypothetical protein
MSKYSLVDEEDRWSDDSSHDHKPLINTFWRRTISVIIIAAVVIFSVLGGFVLGHRVGQSELREADVCKIHFFSELY